MPRKVKVELYDGSRHYNGFDTGFYTVVIPMPSKENETTKRVNETMKRKVVIRNWGNNEYVVAMFHSINALSTNDTYRGKMKDVASKAAEFLYGGR